MASRSSFALFALTAWPLANGQAACDSRDADAGLCKGTADEDGVAHLQLRRASTEPQRHNKSRSDEGLILEDFLPLCAPEIVTETCSDIFGHSTSDGAVTAADLQRMLAATPAAIHDVWSALGFEAGAAATCTQLCQSTVEVLQVMHAAPPASDVGCYLLGDGSSHEMMCDVDVRPETIKAASASGGEMPDFHGEDKMQELAAAADEMASSAQEGEAMKKNGFPYTVKVSVRRVANLFRIFPVTLSTAGKKADDDEVRDIEGSGPAEQEGGASGGKGSADKDGEPHLQLYSASAEPQPHSESHIDEVDINLEDYLPLCAPEIVTETCSGVFGHDTADGAVTAADLKRMLAATPEAIDVVWSKLGFEAGASATCTQLCQNTVEALRKRHAAPPASDVGCFLLGTRKRHVVKCDVDVRPATIKAATTYQGDLPDFHDEDKLQLLAAAANQTASFMQDVEPLIKKGIPYPVVVAARRVANLFRIYPVTLSTAAEEADDDEVRDIQGSGPAARESLLAAAPPSQGDASAWKAQIQRVNVQAIAYVQTALRKFTSKATQKAMTKWYGPAASAAAQAVQQRLLAILNSVDAMLGNVEFVMGPECSSNTYAYVYPQARASCSSAQLGSKPCTKNDKGQYIFYICDLTLRSTTALQIETLTHEGAHHATAYADDVDFEGGTAYGRNTCMRLAAKDAKKAAENADNFCYYVQDVTDGA